MRMTTVLSCLMLAGTLAGVARADQPVIHKAIHDGDAEYVLRLLKATPQLMDLRNEQGWLPIHEAAFTGRPDITAMLIELGTPVNARGRGNTTPLHLAAGGGHVDVVIVLLKRFALDNLPDVHGMLPIHKAAQRGHTDVVRMLLANGSDPNAEDNYGHTALDWARQKGHDEVVAAIESSPPPATRATRELGTPADVPVETLVEEPELLPLDTMDEGAGLPVLDEAPERRQSGMDELPELPVLSSEPLPEPTPEIQVPDVLSGSSKVSPQMRQRVRRTLDTYIPMLLPQASEQERQEITAEAYTALVEVYDEAELELFVNNPLLFQQRYANTEKGRRFDQRTEKLRKRMQEMLGGQLPPAILQQRQAP